MGIYPIFLTLMHGFELLLECGEKLFLINRKSAPYDHFQGNGELVTPRSSCVPQVASLERTDNIVKYIGLDV